MSSSWGQSGISALLTKMKSNDSDFRFMALNDLMAELSKDSFVHMDDTLEANTVRQVLELMVDPNGEVKNMVVKCLGQLVTRVRERQMQTIVDQLIDYISSKQEEVRDVASLALKTVTAQMPNRANFANTVVNKLAPKLIHQIADPSSLQELLIDSLDILAEVIAKFATAVSANVALQRSIVQAVTPSMAHNRPAVRKRCLSVLGALGSCATSDIFLQLSKHISSEMQSGSASKQTTAIQLVALFARTCPRRLGRRLPEFMPQIFEIANSNDDDDELRETCLQAIQSVLLQCSAEVTPFINSSIQIGLELIKHDPNYALGGDEDDDEEMGDVDDDQDDDEEDMIDQDYSDDDDMSWKVRRASAQVLNAAITSRPEMLAQNVVQVAPALVSRFSEREESVRLQVLDTFLALLRQMQLYGASPQATEVIGANTTAGALKRKHHDMETESPEGNPSRQLLSLVPSIAKALHREMVSKSIPTRHKSFIVLRELVTVLDGGLDAHIGMLLSQTEKSLKGAESISGGGGSASTLKADVLAFFRVLFLTHAAKSFEEQLPQLVPILSRAVQDKLHRNCTEAFLTCSQLIVVLRPIGFAKTAGQYMPYLQQIYTATVARLQRVDSDQEIKERGIACLGILMANAGDDLADMHQESFEILSARLRNEVTRYATIKVITQIATSPVCTGAVFEAFLQDSIGEVAMLLRKSNRQLRLAAFDCLAALLARTSTALSADSCQSILAEVQPLLTKDMDINLLPLILNSVNLILSKDSSTRIAVQQSILPQIYSLVLLPLANGPMMDSLLAFFKAYVHADTASADATVQELFSALDQAKTSTTGTHAYSTVSRCIGAVASVSQQTSVSVATKATKTLEDKNGNDADVYFALLLLGELGRFNDFSTRKGLLEDVLQLYSAESEEVKIGAAFAVGNMAIGALPVFLPIIEQHIKSSSGPKDSTRFLSLHALKELITHGSQEQLAVVAKQVWPVLFEACDTQQEGVRSIGAECLARLTLTDPARYLALLQERLRSPQPSVRAIVIAAVRFTLSTESTTVYDELLGPVLVDFLTLLKDPELEVRRNAMFALNSAAHNKPYLIREHLSVLQPMLYAETQVKAELLRKVSMGPFLVVTDDGLDLRKNAFETMYQLLDTCWSRLKMDEYVDCIVAGLGDSDDEIKTLSYLMIIKLVELRATALTSVLASRLEDLADPIAQTLKSKLKETSTKQEIEKQAELQRFIFKTLVTVWNALGVSIINATNTPKFFNNIQEAKNTPSLITSSGAGSNANGAGALWREIEQSLSTTTTTIAT